MEIIVQDHLHTLKPKILALSLVFVLVVSFFTAVCFSYVLLSYDGIYDGISISGMEVGSGTREQAFEKVSSIYGKAPVSPYAKIGCGPLDSLSFVIKAGRISHEFRYSDIGVDYRIDEAVENAYAIGHGRRFGRNLIDIARLQFISRDIDVPVVYDTDKLNEQIQLFRNKVYIPVRQARLSVNNSSAIMFSGRDGRDANVVDITAQIQEMIAYKTGGTVDAAILHTKKQVPEASAIQKLICRHKADASYIVEQNIPQLVPHIIGRYISLQEIRSILEAVSTQDGTFINLPVRFTIPEITSEKAAQMLFRDELSVMSTRFSAKLPADQNRKVNITLSSAKIDNLVLAPDQVFSFNSIVGKRTEEDGYMKARAYYLGKVVDGVGGGICQVSSTLYNAALLADLEIVERRNHTFTVAYVPLGRDATVSFEQPDFRFRNNTAWPIRISATVTSKNRMIVKLTGTNLAPGKKIELRSEIVKETPFNIIRINAPDLPEGTTKVKQEGKIGYVVDTYKTVRIDGIEANELILGRSIYKPLDEELLVGTKPVAAAPTGASTADSTADAAASLIAVSSGTSR